MNDKELVRSMVKIANTLDEMGLTKEADEVDRMVKEAIDWGGLARGAVNMIPGVGAIPNIIGALRGKQGWGNAIMSSIPGLNMLYGADRMRDALFNKGERWESKEDKDKRVSEEYRKLHPEAAGGAGMGGALDKEYGMPQMGTGMMGAAAGGMGMGGMDPRLMQLLQNPQALRQLMQLLPLLQMLSAKGMR